MPNAYAIRIVAITRDIIRQSIVNSVVGSHFYTERISRNLVTSNCLSNANSKNNNCRCSIQFQKQKKKYIQNSFCFSRVRHIVESMREKKALNNHEL